MSLFLEKYYQVFSILTENEVDFIVVGGYSVIFHGYHRTTGDLDIWLKPDNLNKTKLIQSLEKLGFESESLKLIDRLDFHKPIAFHINDEPEKIEFITSISDLTFEEANTTKVYAHEGALSVPFLNLEHLLLSKMSTGRLKDLADVEELQKIIQLRKNI